MLCGLSKDSRSKQGYILAALSDEHPRVCEQAIVLAEPQIASDTELRKAVIEKAAQ